MSKRRAAIYDPPGKGFPYVVALIDGDEITLLQADSREQARQIVIDERRKGDPKDSSAPKSKS